jgi:hypothetical protein
VAVSALRGPAVLRLLPVEELEPVDPDRSGIPQRRALVFDDGTHAEPAQRLKGEASGFREVLKPWRPHAFPLRTSHTETVGEIEHTALRPADATAPHGLRGVEARRPVHVAVLVPLRVEAAKRQLVTCALHAAPLQRAGHLDDERRALGVRHRASSAATMVSGRVSMVTCVVSVHAGSTQAAIR